MELKMRKTKLIEVDKMHKLPKYVKFMIFNYVDNLKVVMMTCKMYNWLIKSDEFWKFRIQFNYKENVYDKPKNLTYPEWWTRIKNSGNLYKNSNELIAEKVFTISFLDQTCACYYINIYGQLFYLKYNNDNPYSKSLSNLISYYKKQNPGPDDYLIKLIGWTDIADIKCTNIGDFILKDNHDLYIVSSEIRLVERNIRVIYGDESFILFITNSLDLYYINCKNPFINNIIFIASNVKSVNYVAQTADSFSNHDINYTTLNGQHQIYNNIKNRALKIWYTHLSQESKEMFPDIIAESQNYQQFSCRISLVFH